VRFAQAAWPEHGDDEGIRAGSHVASAFCKGFRKR